MGNCVQSNKFRYTVLTDEDIDYIQANTSLSTSEIKQLHKEFLVNLFILNNAIVEGFKFLN